jgi:RAMA domain-containing protein
MRRWWPPGVRRGSGSRRTRIAIGILVSGFLPADVPKRPARHGSLVSRFVEHIPRKALEQRHARDYIAGFRGLYALFKEGRLRYVGLAEDDLERRLRYHLRDHLKNSWDSFSAYCLTDAAAPYLHDLEAAFHRISEPKKNRQKGRFIGGENVSEAIIQRHRAGRLYSLLKNGRLKEGQVLTMRWGRGDHFATLTPDGHILFDGKPYASPSAAGKAVARGNNVDGWAWWHYEASPGVWHQLTSLRRKPLKWSKARRGSSP